MGAHKEEREKIEN